MTERDHKQQGGWLPEQDDLEAWLQGHAERTEDSDAETRWHPAVQQFHQLVTSDPTLRMYATNMIEQVPSSKPYQQRHLHSFEQMLSLVNAVLTTAPEFSEGSMITTPMAGILDWTMGTPAGFAFYRDPRVNEGLKDILNAWCAFLDSEESLYVLNESDTGWKSDKAQQVVGMNQFAHDPADPHWGFTSWNDFFTRRFADGERPVAGADDDRVIVSACESTPYKLSTDVQRRDEFWVKSQPYSLEDLLANDPAVDQFVGGTVYQAFLSATNYHRWHSPVSGTVVRAYVQPGTYFSEADSEGADAVEPTTSQGYLAHVASRAIILIEADNPAIGLVAVVPVGMVEVSSCVIGEHVVPGRHLEKGDDLGYFQFGGSTECVIFRPGAVESFALQAIPQTSVSPVQVRSHLATAPGGTADGLGGAVAVQTWAADSAENEVLA
ncbi:phosphatidylserine decarboxylase family protein [Sinomonas terrae]|uniref:Phosphatidylserine decarboxylase family protein n=1 Tax=Sinomonas terrae TaxID=2908838 RepID=A0ABS9U4U4_9MICC|nr:phosphatidylserine decarboxylase family protein [Sinomonas terrae]MCH6471542.1 phosphatidylserine decarboxylase family protein [Sinomonas terrae]